MKLKLDQLLPWNIINNNEVIYVYLFKKFFINYFLLMLVHHRYFLLYINLILPNH